jgi:hypothetical protein
VDAGLARLRAAREADADAAQQAAAPDRQPRPLDEGGAARGGVNLGATLFPINVRHRPSAGLGNGAAAPAGGRDAGAPPGGGGARRAAEAGEAGGGAAAGGGQAGNAGASMGASSVGPMVIPLPRGMVRPPQYWDGAGTGTQAGEDLA